MVAVVCVCVCVCVCARAYLCRGGGGGGLWSPLTTTAGLLSTEHRSGVLRVSSSSPPPPPSSSSLVVVVVVIVAPPPRRRRRRRHRRRRRCRRRRGVTFPTQPPHPSTRYVDGQVVHAELWALLLPKLPGLASLVAKRRLEERDDDPVVGTRAQPTRTPSSCPQSACTTAQRLPHTHTTSC